MAKNRPPQRATRNGERAPKECTVNNSVRRVCRCACPREYSPAKWCLTLHTVLHTELMICELCSRVLGALSIKAIQTIKKGYKVKERITTPRLPILLTTFKCYHRPINVAHVDCNGQITKVSNARIENHDREEG